jgi:hypothetical protein
MLEEVYWRRFAKFFKFLIDYEKFWGSDAVSVMEDV